MQQTPQAGQETEPKVFWPISGSFVLTKTIQQGRDKGIEEVDKKGSVIGSVLKSGHG